MSSTLLNRAALAALAVLMLAQMWTSDLRLSVTSDEIDHLHAGYRYLTCRDFGWNPEHPPLVKMVAALPLLFMHVNDPIRGACGLSNNKGIDFRAGHDFFFANTESILSAARFATSIFAIALLIASWMLAKKLFGRAVATLSAVLLAFEPTILGHGALVTTDVPAAFGFVLAVYATYCYVEKPAWPRAVLLGLSIGIALGLKHPTVLLALVVPLLLAADLWFADRDTRRHRLLAHAATLGLVTVIAVVSIWAAYDFSYSGRPSTAAVWPLGTQAGEVHGFLSTKAIPDFIERRLLPEPYLIGLQDVATVSEQGRQAFLLGHSYFGGKWIYFPVAAAIKFTLPFLLLILISASAWSFWKSNLCQLSFLLIPLGVLLAFAFASNINVGFRHVMPIIPFLAIFASAGALDKMHSQTSRKAALAGILVFHVATCLHAFPNYISYSNEAWGGPTRTYKYLADSNADWGQAQKMARDYITQTRPVSCFLLQAYNERAADYGIPCGSMSEMEDDKPPEIFTGTLIVSSSAADGTLTFAGGVRAARLFRNMPVKTMLGGSALLVYEGNFDLRPLASAMIVRRNVDPAFTPQERMERARWAATLDPNNPDAHMILCRWSNKFGDFSAAQKECNTGLRLILSDDETSPWIRRRALGYLESLGIPIDSENQALAQADRVAAPPISAR